MPPCKTSLIAYCAIALIKAYRNSLSIMMLSSCRFSPTCSEYSMQAIEQHGVMHGIWLTIRRLVRCNPLGPAGYDPVK